MGGYKRTPRDVPQHRQWVSGVGRWLSLHRWWSCEIQRVDGGLPLYFGMIAERGAKSFASRGMVMNGLDIGQDKKK